MTSHISSHPVQDSAAIQEVISAAFRFIEARGIVTFDPFDFADTDRFKKIAASRNPATLILRKCVGVGSRLAPLATRKFLCTVPKAAPGGVAALAMAYNARGDVDALRKARTHLQWLCETAVKGDGFIGWGFPYDWRSRGKLVPRGTPIGHTTMTCGNALLRFFEATGEKWVKAPLESLCNFFDLGLNKTERSADSIALSYTPLDNSQVINIDADIGSLLWRVALRLDHPKFSSLARKLIGCVLETQNEDGSWYYYTADSVGGPSIIDNHHTGMVLSALSEVLAEMPADHEARPRVERALLAGTHFFLERLFTPEGLPRYCTKKLYPIEIYNFAQSIITCLDLLPHYRGKPLHEEIARRLGQVTHHLLKGMRNREGGFLYRKYPLRATNLHSLRWGNALTTFALVRYQHEFLTPLDSSP